jgi:type VI secretion system secreted protein VgrG
MAENLFSISSDALPSDAHVVAFKGSEGLSELYAFEIGILTGDATFNQDDAVLARATLTINLGDEGEPQSFHGVFAAFELVQDYLGRFLYRGVLVPKLWQLTLTKHSNVWVDESIDDIITQVLEWSGLTSDEFSLRLEGSYDKRDFVAQYKESNYAFISRWMEREGMFFFFEHGSDKETMVIVDKKPFDEGTDPQRARYVPLSEGDTMALEAFNTFRCKSSALPAKVELWDYDYLNPTLDVRGAASASPTGVGEIACFGDDNFLTPNVGNHLAKIRAEEILAKKKVFHARGRVFHMRSGSPFVLEEHPRPDFADKKYLVTHVKHVGNQSTTAEQIQQILEIDQADEYICEVRAIPADIQYRSPDRFPWPRIEGYESATVCGEADSEYAQIDDHGRYKVRIKFDESDLGDGKASAWVRMQQPYGGTNEGFHFPLIKNTEVLLWFMGGDPDRPVIAGVVPNAQTPSPVVNNNHTTNIIQTVNLNLIEIEDTRNEQYIYVYCPVENTFIHMGVLNADFNLILNTEGHAHFNFGGLQVIDVALTLTENVTLDVTFNYDANWICNVKADNNITIDGDLNLVVAGDVNWQIGGDWNVVIAGDNNLQIGGDQNIQIAGDLNVDVGGDNNTIIAGDQNLTIAGDQNVNITGDQNVTINGKQNIDVTSDWKWNVLGHEIKIKSANSTELTVGLKNEAFIGIKNSLFVGGQMNATLAMMMELKAAMAMSLTLGMFLNMKGSMELNLTAGANIAIDAGLKLGIHGGAAISLFGGVKFQLEGGIELKLVGGPNIKLTPVEIHI